MATQHLKDDLSAKGQQALDQYEHHLRREVDLSEATVRAYLGDVRLFMLWCERSWVEGREISRMFAPDQVATPTITRYRNYLQHELGREPATVNRYLTSLKRYFAWATDVEIIARDPSRVVKLVKETTRAPRHLSDQEEEALVAAVEASGNLRDRTLIIVMLHTGLRVGEVCNLKQEQIIRGKRSGHLRVWGKHNKYREVPLNVTVRKALKEFQDTLPPTSGYLFLSQRTRDKLTPRAIGFIINKYVRQAGISNLRPHDLRHRFGYRMAERVPIHRLAQIMGHDSLDTTMIYVQGTQADLQYAVETIAWE